jgi:hypothetical protein
MWPALSGFLHLIIVKPIIVKPPPPPSDDFGEAWHRYKGKVGPKVLGPLALIFDPNASTSLWPPALRYARKREPT